MQSRPRFAHTKRKFWPPETRFLWPCAGKTVRPRSAPWFRAGETQILTCRGRFVWPCGGETQIWPPETHFGSISCGFTRCHYQMNENRHGASARRQNFFKTAVSRGRNTNFALPRRVFCGPAQGKHPDQNPTPGANLNLNLPLAFTVRTPQCGHTVWGKKSSHLKEHLAQALGSDLQSGIMTLCAQLETSGYWQISKWCFWLLLCIVHKQICF